MKKSFYKVISAGAFAAFFLYWYCVIILAMPPNRLNQKVGNEFPRFKKNFTGTWKLFTPPFIYHNRLYFIIRETGNPGIADTIEVLESISIMKQAAAPFNQREIIIDYCVSNNVEGLKKTIWRNKKKPGAIFTSRVDSTYIAQAVAAVANSNLYKICFGSIKNYCMIFLKEKKIDPVGKEVKIVIKEKMIRPFKELNNSGFVPTEIIVFETPYQLVHL